MTEPSRRDFLKLGGLAAATLAFGRLPNLTSGGPETNRNYFDVLNSQTQNALAAKAASFISSTQLGNGPLAADQLIGTTTFGFKSADFLGADIREIGRGTEKDPFFRAFPRDSFDAFGVFSPILNFDFNSANLQPGDFLYFIGGSSASDYMMTISRRDREGTLWAVTNCPDQNGKYAVKEVPAWSPKNPEASFIKDLAKGNNSMGISSGQNGFALFRLKSGRESSYDSFDHSETAQELQKNVGSFVAAAKGDWHVMISDIDSGKILAENISRLPRYSASLTKVPLAMSTLAYLEYKTGSPEELQRVLKTTYLEGYTFDSQLRTVFTDSDETAAHALSRYLASEKVDIQALLLSQGIANTNIQTRISTEEDIWKLFKNLHDINNSGILKYPSSHEYLLNYMKIYKSEAKVWLETLRARSYGLDIGDIYHKRGFVDYGNLVVVADSGIVEVKGKSALLGSKSYFISLNGQPRKGFECDFSTLGGELLSFVDVFAKYLKGN